MPRGHSTVSRLGSRLNEESRRLLAYIREHENCTRQQVRAAMPDLDVNAKLTRLQAAGLIFGQRHTGQAGLRFSSRFQPELVDEVKLRGPARGQLPARRVRDMYADWREPYLSDAGVRRDGLQFRECGSRRGEQLVFCWRRQA